MTIGSLRRKDERLAMRFAAVGMHFDWYLDSPLLLKLYSRYFWYTECCRATQIIAAYQGRVLIGLLLAEIRGETPKKPSLWRRLYVNLFKRLQSIFSPQGGGMYERTNAELFEAYQRDHSPDGEIIFLAANPFLKVKGVGTALLQELERREAGKELYLFTDSGCSWQFYEHRGFKRVGEKEFPFEMGGKKLPLTCLLYSKTVP